MLRPKKSKELIPELAHELQVSPTLIEDVTGHYWGTVREALSKMKNIRVHIANLGDFTAKHWLIDKEIERLEKFEENNNQRGFQKISARYKNAEKIYDLKQLKKIAEDEHQRKEFIITHKKTVYETTKSTNPLEEQGSDPGGN